MATDGGKTEVSPNGNGEIDADAPALVDMKSIVEETSADLKIHENSPTRNWVSASRASKAEENETKDPDGNRKKSNKAGNEDESSTSPLTNNGDINRYGDGNTDEPLNAGANNDDDKPTDELSNTEKTKQFIKQFRKICGRFVNDDRVQWTMVACIIVNSLMMGFATMDWVKNSEELEEGFEEADRVFLAIFTIELALHFIYLQFKMFLDGWLVFDFIVIVASLISTSLEQDVSSFQIFRLLRIFRVFRLVTRVKIMKDLILALFGVMPRMGAIFLMLLLIFYIFAVMFTQIFSDAKYIKTNKCDGITEGDKIPYFKSLEQSMMTLFQLMTMDEWASIVRALMSDYPRLSWILVIIFVIISGFIVVNLIVAVICDAISSLSDGNKAALQGRGYDDDDSQITRVELRDQLETIEDQIGDLTRIQARTFHTLQYLTQQLQLEKEKTGDKDGKDGNDNRENLQMKKDKRATMMKKTLSGERSRRRGFAQTGFKSKRKNYTDTWTQEGSDKTLRREMVSNFAKSARQLQKMRDKEETIAKFAKSARELQRFRDQEESLRKTRNFK